MRVAMCLTLPSSAVVSWLYCLQAASGNPGAARTAQASDNEGSGNRMRQAGALSSRAAAMKLSLEISGKLMLYASLNRVKFLLMERR